MLVKDLPLLAVELPEDILKAKWCGDLERAARLIDLYVSQEKTPLFLKKRLQMEKQVLERLTLYYGYTVEEALGLVREEIPDFTEEELWRLMDESKADWIYLSGRPALAYRFFETLKDVNPDISARAARGRGEEMADNQAQNADFEQTPNSRLKNLSMNAIRENGKRTDCFRLRASVRIADGAFRPGRVMAHLPIPKPQINMSDIRILKVTPGPSETCKVTIAPEDAPQRTVAWETELKENTTFEVEYEYTSSVCYNDLSKPPLREEQQAKAWNEGPVLPEDTAEKYPHIRFTETVRQLVRELTEKIEDKESPEGRLKMARAFYDYCTVNATYSYMRSYFTLEEIPEYVILGRKGDCGVLALLFITLCRCAGIPARWQSSLYVTPDFEGMSAEAGMHDWAMFHIDGRGWLFADPSFGGSAWRAGNKDRWNYYFGNLDTFRMAANSDFQAEFIPSKRQPRIDPYDNQSGEIEYEDRGLYGKDVICRREVLEHRQID